jgi:hypothetical protein
MGGVMIQPIFIGLDYVAVKTISDALDVELSPRMLARIKYLESLEIQRLNKKEA